MSSATSNLLSPSVWLSDEYLQWHLDEDLKRERRRAELIEELMGKHSHPEDTAMLIHTGYQCETCKGYWAALEPSGADRPEELPCLATEGCDGRVVALYPTDEPVPEWIPVIIQGDKQ